MELNVILCCAVALCFEFAASLPYSVDSQKRYTGYQTRPSADSYYQSNILKPYQYPRYDASAYRTPAVQKQEQQLPKVNRDNYFARNQQRYLPKSPPKGPPQAEVQNRRDASQQNTPSEYYPNRQVIEKRPVHIPFQTIDSGQFYPAIPAVPFRLTYSSASASLRQVDDSIHQLESPHLQEKDILVTQPPPRVESVPDVDTFNRLFAKASNPVELEPEPIKPQRPLLDVYLSHPKIREALSNTKQKKRFLVIHPDGTVEHVDRLQTVAEKHPNYFLVNADDVVSNLRKKKLAATTLVPQLPVPPSPPTKPSNTTVETKIEKPVTLQSVVPQEVPKSVSEVPSTVQVEAVVLEPSTLSPPVIAPVVETYTTEATSTPAVEAIQPSEINIEKEVIPPSDSNQVNVSAELAPSVAVTITSNEVAAIAAVPEAVTTADPTTAVPVTSTIGIESSTTIPENLNTEGPKSPVSDVVVEVETLPTSQVEATSQLADVRLPAIAEVLAKAEEELPYESLLTLALAYAQIDNKSSDPASVGDTQPPKNDAVARPPTPSNPVNEGLSNIDQYILEEIRQMTPSPEVVIPTLEDLDKSKTPKKPIWFRTSEPNFLEKLAEKDKGLDVVYFFQIHNQPKIEKNVKTTIHPNGTVVEDTIETLWAFEGDEPTVTRSTKVIHPEDL